MNFEKISQRSGCVSVLHPWVRGEHSTALVCLGWTIARLPAASSGQPGLAQCPRDVEKSFDFCLEGSRVNPQLWLGCSALPAVLIEGTEELQKKPGSQKSSHSLEVHLTPLENPKTLTSVQVPVWISASGSPKRGKIPSPGLVCQLGHSFTQPSLTLCSPHRSCALKLGELSAREVSVQCVP